MMAASKLSIFGMHFDSGLDFGWTILTNIHAKEREAPRDPNLQINVKLFVPLPNRRAVLRVSVLFPQ